MPVARSRSRGRYTCYSALLRHGRGPSRMGRDAGGTWLVNRRARGPQSLTRRGGGVQQRPQAPADPKVSHEQVGAGTTTRLGQAAGERCGRRGGWEVCVGAVADGIGQVPFLRYLRWSRRRVGVGEGRVAFFFFAYKFA